MKGRVRRCPVCRELVDPDRWAVVRCVDCVAVEVAEDREATGRHDWWDDDE